MSKLIDFKLIEEAKLKLETLLSPTPLHYASNLSRIFGAEIYLKLECFQPIKVFKIRGAYNKILNLSDQERKKGLVTASSGNHGIAVSYVANELNLNSIVCLPKGANPSKVNQIKKFGAKIVQEGENYDDSYKNAIQIVSDNQSTLVHPFNDPLVIAGQGTIGLELIEQLPTLNTVIVPIGGGGLISGISLALKHFTNDVKILGVQPQGAPSMFTSIQQDKIVRLNSINTIADGLAAKEPGNLTFEITRKLVDDIFLLNENEIRQSIIDLLIEENILSEPSGAASLSALQHYNPSPNEKIVLLISGGNISRQLINTLFQK